MTLANICFEMSLKPFGRVPESQATEVARTIFRQWDGLIREADMVSILLWVADGSEILDYKAEMDAPIEWGRYLGKANPQTHHPAPAHDPERIGIHHRPRYYMENPPVITYRRLKGIIETLKSVGREMTGKKIRVGATFDPGTEFAKSPFKFERHREICMGATDGPGSWVCCYATLHGDKTHYAGFPEGIPEGTPLGTFLGRQARLFMGDLGFDYLWFSNGFGFGLETWKATGALFDGKSFDAKPAARIRERILDFWAAYHKECPDFPIETRGTNLGVGIDLASDAVPLREIYNGGFNMVTPPNSPWAALDGDFGIELSGYMSRIAELPPGKGFPFRYYPHDPWWINSPWLDRYGREPHDIYLPMAISRIDGSGKVETHNSLLFLTIDDSFGLMPEQVPQEVIPHIVQGLRCKPDAAGPLVWLYPFDEYHDMTFGSQPRLAEPYFGDWFIRQAINNALPLNTVVSTKAFLAHQKLAGTLYKHSILVTPVPDRGTPLSASILSFVEAGGKVMLYGPIANADKRLQELLGVTLADPIEGELEIELKLPTDQLTGANIPTRITHRPALSAGGYEAEIAANSPAQTLATVHPLGQPATRRAAAILAQKPEWKGGGIVWIRGTNPNTYKDGDALLTPDDSATVLHGDLLLRYAISRFGYEIFTRKDNSGQRNPVLAVSRHANGFVFSGFLPNTNVDLSLRFPQGAPIFTGVDTLLNAGRATYRMPRAFQEEVRIFLEQSSGEISCVEQSAIAVGVRRRIFLSGLQDATLRFYPDAFDAPPKFLYNPPKHLTEPIYAGNFVEGTLKDDALGRYYEVKGVSGRLQISW